MGLFGRYVADHIGTRRNVTVDQKIGSGRPVADVHHHKVGGKIVAGTSERKYLLISNEHRQLAPLERGQLPQLYQSN